MASVACACGQVSYRFVFPRMRTRLACCCVDCRQAVEWSASKGGRTVDRTIPKDLVYFENDVVDVRGAERVELVRLRADLCRASAFSTERIP